MAVVFSPFYSGAARPEHENPPERGQAANGVNHGRTRKFTKVVRAEIAATPGPVAGGRIDGCNEREAERGERAKLDTLSDHTKDNDSDRSSKYELEEKLPAKSGVGDQLMAL